MDLSGTGTRNKIGRHGRGQLVRIDHSRGERGCIKFTTAPEAKPLPLTVNVNAGLPAVIVSGLMEPMAGAATMVKATWIGIDAARRNVDLSSTCTRDEIRRHGSGQLVRT